MKTSEQKEPTPGDEVTHRDVIAELQNGGQWMLSHSNDHYTTNCMTSDFAVDMPMYDNLDEFYSAVDFAIRHKGM